MRQLRQSDHHDVKISAEQAMQDIYLRKRMEEAQKNSCSCYKCSQGERTVVIRKPDDPEYPFDDPRVRTFYDITAFSCTHKPEAKPEAKLNCKCGSKTDECCDTCAFSGERFNLLDKIQSKNGMKVTVTVVQCVRYQNKQLKRPPVARTYFRCENYKPKKVK